MEGQFNTNHPIRVLVVDDNASMRQAIAIIIQDEPDMSLCGEAAAMAPAIQQCEVLHPDLALVDISLRGEDGLALVRHIRDHFPQIRVVVFSLHEEKHYINLACEAGAHGYAIKSGDPERMLMAMRMALDYKSGHSSVGRP